MTLPPSLLDPILHTSSAWDPIIRPDDFSVVEIWTDGGPVYDLNSLVVGMTTTRISSFDLSQDGTRLILTNTTDDTIECFTLSTPFDFSTGTKTSSRAATNAVGIRWNRDGDGYSYQDTLDDMFSYSAISTWEVSAGSDTLGSQADKTEWGHSGATDGHCWFNDDGTAAYHWIEVSSQTTLARAELGTAYDLDTIGTIASQDFEPPRGGLVVREHSYTDPTEQYIYDMGSEILIFGTYAVLGDVTSIVWDTVNTLDLSSYGVMGHVWVSDDGKVIYCSSDAASTPKIIKLTAT